MLDRYTVIRELGAGAMGKVYLAYDDQLDRRVAIKLLHGSVGGDSEAKRRLQREAQAMAKLSHPNVVTVYEVGSYEGELFVAMEYVKGQDLRSWLAAATRELEALRAVFLAAGAGLAAAHDAGLVHRDFKPDNVLVGDDGRARVADFGLAYGLRGADTSNTEDERASTSASALDLDLTRTGALVGTPAYMSPEQMIGLPTDARSDQFSFCVALWEALHGQRPFHGDTMNALSERVIGGQLTPPPGEPLGGALAWMHAVALRGLSTDPSERWPDMHALLDALADDPAARRRRRRRGIALAVATTTLLAALAGVATRELRGNARHRYWNALTEQLLALERERGFRQAEDDAQRARDATKMSVYRRYRARVGAAEHEDPTVAAALLREVGEEARGSEAWISAANLALGRPLSHALLTDHADTIFALSFSPSEDALYSAAADGEVRRWDLASGRGERLYRHAGAVNALTSSPDGRTLASAAEDGTLRTWRTDAGEGLLLQADAGLTAAQIDPRGRLLVATGRQGRAWLLPLAGSERRVLDDHGAAVLAADFDDSGALVLTAAADGRARLWRSRDGALLATLVGHSAPIYHARIATTPDAPEGASGHGHDAPAWAITGADDGTIRAWPLTGEGHEQVGEAVLLADHGAAISALDLAVITVGAGTSAAPTRVASAAIDGSVYLSELPEPGAQPRPPRAVSGHTAGVWSLAVTAEGDLITAALDGVARVFPANAAGELGPPRALTGHREPLLRLAVSPSGRWLATGSWDTDVRVWDLERPALERPLIGHRDKLQSVAIDGAGRRVLTASSDRSARVWDAETGASVARLDAPRPLNLAVFSPDGARVVAGHDNGMLSAWLLDSGEHLERPAHATGVRALSFSPDGARLASASSDGSAKIWRADLSEAPLVLRGHEDRVMRVAFDVAGERLITASADATARVWDAETGALVSLLSGHEGAIRALASSPDGRVWATAADDHSARLWPELDPARALVLSGHQKRVHAVAFSPSGARVVTASADATARVWDAETGALISVLSGHAGALWDACFVDEDRVLSASDDNSLRLWSVAGDEATIELIGHADAVTGLALAPDRRWTVSASVDGSARIWRLELLGADPTLLVEALRAATLACLAPAQRERELGEAPPEAARAFAACERGYGR
nr:protein kinase [Pseudenhygromyxa sp. WMMC2535]